MKKILMAIAAAVLLISPSICFASYVIHLKDGRQFVTDRYWEEGERIKFKRYGGVIGIQRDQVKEIEEIKDLPDENKTAGPETPSAQTEDTGKPEVPEKAQMGKQGIPGGTERPKGSEQVKEQEKKKAEQEKAAEIKAFLEEKRLILKERERVSSKFKEAKARNDRDKKDENWNKLLLLQKQLSRLRRQVKAAHQGKLPPWWYKEE